MKILTLLLLLTLVTLAFAASHRRRGGESDDAEVGEEEAQCNVIGRVLGKRRRGGVGRLRKLGKLSKLRKASRRGRARRGGIGREPCGIVTRVVDATASVLKTTGIGDDDAPAENQVKNAMQTASDVLAPVRRKFLKWFGGGGGEDEK